LEVRRAIAFGEHCVDAIRFAFSCDTEMVRTGSGVLRAALIATSNCDTACIPRAGGVGEWMPAPSLAGASSAIPRVDGERHTAFALHYIDA
jgi:hypothetical protein